MLDLLSYDTALTVMPDGRILVGKAGTAAFAPSRRKRALEAVAGR